MAADMTEIHMQAVANGDLAVGLDVYSTKHPPIFPVIGFTSRELHATANRYLERINEPHVLLRMKQRCPGLRLYADAAQLRAAAAVRRALGAAAADGTFTPSATLLSDFTPITVNTGYETYSFVLARNNGLRGEDAEILEAVEMTYDQLRGYWL